MCEFTDNGRIFMLSYPHLFPLGEGFNVKSSATDRMKDVYTKHHSHTFEKDKRFMFHLFDQQLRHTTCQRVSTRVKNNTKLIKEFEDLVNMPNFEKKIKEAITKYKKGPDKETRSLVAKLLRCMTVVGGDIPLSDAEKNISRHQIINMQHFFGSPGIYFTISPDDTNSPLSLKLAGRDDIIQQNKYSFNERHTILAENCVAAARSFHRQIESCWTSLF